jgi:hypothetical protein
MTTADLVPDPVTAASRELYVQLSVQVHQLIYDAVSSLPHAKLLVAAHGSISKQFIAFAKGFFIVCGGPALEMFKPRELQLLMCGSPTQRFSRSAEGCHFRRRVR